MRSSSEYSAFRVLLRHQKEPENGCGFAALALRALAVILERCRLDRLTRNQHILFRLGELITYTETAAVFAERVLSHPTEAIQLDTATRQALARIHAREAALKVATDGLRWTVGAGQSDPNLANSLQLPAIYAAQSGLLEDMNYARDHLNQAF